MAFSACTASAATVVCAGEAVEVEEETGTTLQCPEGFVYGEDIEEADTISGALASDSPHGTGSGEVTLDFAGGSERMTCASSTLTASAESSGSPAANGQVTELGFGSCTTTLSGCSVKSTSTSPPLAAELLYEGLGGSGPNGSVSLGEDKVSVALSCASESLKPTCIYRPGGEKGSESLTGDFYNPENENAPSVDEGAVLDLEMLYTLSKTEGSGTELCPSLGTLNATYVVSADAAIPSELALTQKKLQTKLCESEPKLKNGILTCAKPFAGVIVNEPASTWTLASTAGPKGTITCNNTSFKGNFEESGKGFSETLNFAGGGAMGRCTSTLNVNPDASVDFASMPLASRFVYASASGKGGHGRFLIPTPSYTLRMFVTVWQGKNPLCEYRDTDARSEFKNGFGATPSTLSMRRYLDLADEDPVENKCPTGLKVTTTMTIKGISEMKPINIYIAGE
jgi:hypothetical protein